MEYLCMPYVFSKPHVQWTSFKHSFRKKLGVIQKVVVKAFVKIAQLTHTFNCMHIIHIYIK